MKIVFHALSSVFASVPLAFGNPIVSEVLVDNTDWEDDYAQSPGWIEIENTAGTPVSTEGLELKTEGQPTGWPLPTMTLEPGAVRVVYASGRNRSNPDEGFLHSDFTLPRSKGFVALTNAGGDEVSRLDYPEPDENVSYGRLSDKVGFMYPATPGAPNGQPEEGAFPEDVVFSHSGGMVSGPLTLTLTAPDLPGAKIYYTLTGDDPKVTLFTPTYDSPIEIAGSVTVKARVSVPNMLPGKIVSATFLMMDESLTDFAGTGDVFDSNLPVLYLDSFGANIDSIRDFRPSYALLIRADEATGRARLDGPAEYNGPAATHQRGESSSGFGQKSFSLELRDWEGNDKSVSLLDMPAESDWVLYGPWSEKTLVRNKLVFDWMRELRGDDGTSIRSEFIELFFRQDEKELVSYNHYRGIYLLMEKIKRDDDRVPIADLNEHTTHPELITGGYIFRRDKVDNDKPSWNTARGQPLQAFDPDDPNEVQLDYLKEHINEFERVAYSDDRGGEDGFRKFIEVDTFIDVQWMTEIAKQVDGYVFSTYYHKRRNGKIRAGPLWDFNISLGNADYGSGESPEGWLYNNSKGDGGIWFPQLHKDPEYKRDYWDRYWYLRQRMLSEEAIEEKIAQLKDLLLDGYDGPVGNREPDALQNPVARHFREYPHIGSRQWPNPPAETSLDTWQDELDYMKDWLFERLDWIDDWNKYDDGKIYRAPIPSHREGAYGAPISVKVTRYKGTLFSSGNYPDGPIWVTLDGSDPRADDGSINDSAFEYSEPLEISEAVTLKARLHKASLFDEGEWSPLAEATYVVASRTAAPGDVVVSEFMYHPAEPTAAENAAGFNDNSFFEFIEITNTTTETLDLSETELTNGIFFEFSEAMLNARRLEPGQSLVLVADTAAFAMRYPGVAVAGQYTGKLRNGGERVTYSTTGGTELFSFRYDDVAPWPVEADGDGKSLVWAGLGGDPNEAGQWLASAENGGSPGVFSQEPKGDFTGDPNGDTDGDGMNDLVEYAVGTDWQDAASAASLHVSVVPLEMEGARDNYVLARWQVDPGAAATISLEASIDLNAWTDADFDSHTVEDMGSGLQSISMRTKEPIDNNTGRFLRLKASLK